MPIVFSDYWKEYCFKSLEQRRLFFDSLSHQQKSHLLDSFKKDGWLQFFMANKVEQIIRTISLVYNIDLISMRIQSIKFNKTFLIEKNKWDEIENILWSYDEHYNMDSIFGGLLITEWGRKKQFYRIRSNSRSLNGTKETER